MSLFGGGRGGSSGNGMAAAVAVFVLIIGLIALFFWIGDNRAEGQTFGWHSALG